MNKPKQKSAMIAVAAALGLAVAIGAGYRAFAGNEVKTANSALAQPAATPVSVAAVIDNTITEWDEFSGRLEAVERVEIRPRVSGTIDAIHFQEGALVKKGDVLFVIDPRPYAAEVSRAEASLAAAQARAAYSQSELARAGRLLADNAIAKREFDERENAAREAQAALRGAQAALETARLNLGYTRITAPVAGRVSRAEITVGNLVAGSANAPVLTTLVSVSPIYASFEADEQSFLKYAANGSAGNSRQLPVHLGLANEEGYPRQGRVQSVDNRLDPRAGTIRVRAVFDNADGKLTPGLYARIRLGGTAPHRAILVNERVVGTDQGKKFVLVVGEGNKVAYREVKLGPVHDGLRVVREGLEANERLVVNGLQRVKPGDVVDPKMVAMEARPEVDARREREERLTTGKPAPQAAKPESASNS